MIIKPFEEKEQKELFIAAMLAWILFSILVLTLYAWGIQAKDILPGCVLYEKYGMYCPGCGGTRAVICLLRGQFLKSFFYHPLVLYVAAVGGTFCISNILYKLNAIKWKLPLRPIHFYGAVLITLGQWIVKLLLY